MRIAVFGATGPTGRSFVTQALAAGHEVRALARRADALTDAPGLDVVVGDARDKAIADEVVAGADAVACFLGLRKPEGTSVSDATQTICDAMSDAGIRRLVVVSVMGVGDSIDHFSRPAKVATRLFLGKALPDRRRQEEVVAASGLDYTIIRPVRLVDGDATSHYAVGSDLRAGLPAKVVRADLAACVLNQLQATGSGDRALSIVGS